jgi:hypothetical protein
VNHMPFDNGAIADAFMDILNWKVEQKTIKTRCSKRVVMAHANHKAPIDCPICLADMQREAIAIANLRALTAKP